jgi:hypothetical protein
MAIWSILQLFGIFCGPLVHSVFWVHFFPVLVRCTKKNLANLCRTIPCKHFLFFNAIEDQNGRIIPVECLFERTLQNGFENKTQLKVSSVFAEFKVQRFCADFHIPECQYVEHPFITGTA